jgi:hypothetical protein
MPYFVNWIRDGQISRFAHPHHDLNSALDFACEAFRIECSDVWVIDENGQKGALGRQRAAPRPGGSPIRNRQGAKAGLRAQLSRRPAEQPQQGIQGTEPEGNPLARRLKRHTASEQKTAAKLDSSCYSV